MTPKKVENIVRQELGDILTGYSLLEKNFYYCQDDKHTNRYNFYTRKIGGEIYLEILLLIKINRIEEKWEKFITELCLGIDILYPSFYGTLGFLKKEDFPCLSIVGLKVNYNESEDWVKEQTRKIVEDYYLPFAEKLKDIHYCDQLINKDIEITEEVCKLSPIDGLPFRKIFIAEAANNPRLDEIKEAMRVFVNEQYILGKRENFEALCKIKPVFEKLFGT